jgi:hypothetical protein
MKTALQKKPILKKNSIGNVFRLYRSRQSINQRQKAPKELTEIDIIREITAFTCPCLLPCKSNCILKHFTTPNNQMNPEIYTYFRMYRKEVIYKNNNELKVFISDKFKDSIESTDSFGKYKMKYQLNGPTGNYTVCRDSIAKAYGFSVYMIRDCAKSYKQNTVPAFVKQMKSFSVKKSLPYSYKEVEEIFDTHVPDFHSRTG